MRLAFVLWDGDIGGAEVQTAKLAQRLQPHGVAATIVFVTRPEPLVGRLGHIGVPHASLGLGRGRAVLYHPREYAAAVAHAGPDGALLVECGFLGAALRAGGYRRPIVAVEHGPLNELPNPVRRLARAGGAWADDVEVAVSDYMLAEMRRRSHARRLVRIYHGVDPDVDFPAEASPRDCHDGSVVVGFMGRLVPGKGADHLIRALTRAGRARPARLLVAGDGPDRPRLAALAQELGVDRDVEFLGVVDDVPAFWAACDVAAVPTAELHEAFSMVTLEAMASGKPIVATRSGAIPELVRDGETGRLVDRGDVDALAKGLLAYAEDPGARHADGAAARRRAIERFHIEDSARAYLDIFSTLITNRRGPIEPSKDDGTR